LPCPASRPPSPNRTAKTKPPAPRRAIPGALNRLVRRVICQVGGIEAHRTEQASRDLTRYRRTAEPTRNP
jgi:hypothetical protein